LLGSKIDNAHLEFRFLAADHMVLVVTPGHSLTRQKRVSVDELRRHPLVLREVGSGLRQCFERSLERAGRSLGDLRVALELGSNQAVKEAVRQGVGLAILSRYAVQIEVDAAQLHALEMSDLQGDRQMFIVRDRRRVLPLPARLFLVFLEAHPIQAHAR
jgi:DNA-binding transcriptional LysR family regulator